MLERLRIFYGTREEKWQAVKVLFTSSLLAYMLTLVLYNLLTPVGYLCAQLWEKHITWGSADWPRLEQWIISGLVSFRQDDCSGWQSRPFMMVLKEWEGLGAASPPPLYSRHSKAEIQVSWPPLYVFISVRVEWRQQGLMSGELVVDRRQVKYLVPRDTWKIVVFLYFALQRLPLIDPSTLFIWDTWRPWLEGCTAQC